MLNVKEIRDKPEETERRLKRRDPTLSLTPFLQVDRKLRREKSEVESLRAERNRLSKSQGEDREKGRDLSKVIREREEALQLLEREWKRELYSLPNLPTAEIPTSQNVEEKEIISQWGEKRDFAFPIRDHLQLSQLHQLFDFPRGARMTGSGWPVYRGWGARLEWALLQYMIDLHLQENFTFWLTPHVVKEEMLEAVGQLPKFRDQQYFLSAEETHLCLLPTAEVSLHALHHGENLPQEELPLFYLSYTPCFRREAGAAGKREQGLIRNHQFNKVEMFCLCTPEQSELSLQKMIARAEAVLQGLELPYRVALLPTGDTSFAATKTIDVEVWLPALACYREVSSISYCTDFQTRRSRTHYTIDGGEKRFIHTLNGSGVATSRSMVALLETHQRENGSIRIPPALRPYLSGQKEISVNNKE